VTTTLIVSPISLVRGAGHLSLSPSLRYLDLALIHGGPHDEVESKVTYAEEEDAYLYRYPDLALVHAGGPHDNGNYLTYPVLDQKAATEIDGLFLALVHGGPHGDGNYLTYPVLDQTAAGETDDLCPLSSAEISRWIENHLFFLLLLLG
jgi:hypothetical protein